VTAQEQLTIRPYDDEADAVDTWRVFHAAVHRTAIRDYTPEQVGAWAPPIIDDAAWSRARSTSHTYVACLGDDVVGFSDFTDDGVLDMLFVHPDAAGRGAARALVTHVLAEAEAAGHHRLTTHASVTARPAFERLGFTVERAQSVERRGQTFRNFRMSIRLGHDDR
jgi:putative acetyltransferase